MRTTTLFVIQTVVVIGYLACSSTAGHACCQGKLCHDIPKGCHCPFKAVLCGDYNTLTLGKRKSEDPYKNEQSPQQHYQHRRPQQSLSRADRRLNDDQIVGVLNNLLKLLKETHQADQEAFSAQNQNANDDWEAVTSSRKQPSEHAHSVYQRQSLFSDDVY